MTGIVDNTKQSKYIHVTNYEIEGSIVIDVMS